MAQSTIEKKIIHKEARPFWCKKKSECGILFIHGFGDSLWRINGFADLLKKNFGLMGVLLAGHGTHHDDLLNYTPGDWLRDCENELLKFSKSHKKIYIVGISFGGNLAFDLAIKYPDIVAGIICFETPIRITNHELIRICIPFAKPFMKYYNKNKELNINESKFLKSKGIYEKIPLISAERVLKYMENQRERLPLLKTPLMIIQSKKSDMVDEGNANYIFNNISSTQKEIYWIEQRLHSRMISEKTKILIYKKAIEFFRETNAKHNL